MSSDVFRGDPIRIMESIITGISFLGAGTIIFKNQPQTLEGLTTAASILFVSGIGMAVAINEIIMAAILTLVVLCILFGIGLMEAWIQKVRRKLSYKDNQDDKQ